MTHLSLCAAVYLLSSAFGVCLANAVMYTFLRSKNRGTAQPDVSLLCLELLGEVDTHGRWGWGGVFNRGVTEETDYRTSSCIHR